MRVITTYFVRYFVASVAMFFLAGSGAAQTSTPKPLAANVKEYKLASKLMERDVSYRVVFPAAYDEPAAKDRRFPVIYLLHGLTGNFRNWTDMTKLSDHARDRGFLIVTPDGGNGWYTDSVMAPNDKYESYIINELVGEIDATFRTVATRDGRAIAGLSMGGFGAMKFAMKYPERFYLAGTFSGALGAASFTEKNAGQIGKSIDAIFGVEGAETRKASEIFGLLREMNAEKIKALPFIYQSCGTEDFLIQNNRDFASLLTEKKAVHEYRQLPGAHDFRFWEDQISEFLAVAERRIKK
jgi:putative tributyrin esterase